MIDAIRPSRDDLASYLSMLFEYAEWDGGCIALRGVGEKGTDKEGAPADVVIAEGLTSGLSIDKIFGHVQRWGEHKLASFIVPAVIDAAAMIDRKATEERIRSMTVLVADMDKGNTTEKLEFARSHIGSPTMVVASGGVTETGHTKLHVYWKLSEASDQIANIATARKTLALKLGGDPSFGRATQVIRLPGSIYAKSNARKLCTILERKNVECELDDILQLIDEMPCAPGIDAGLLDSLPHRVMAVSFASGGHGLSFTGYKQAGGDTSRPIGEALTSQIHEGGDDDKNRWSQFNIVAGHYIHTLRAGETTLEEAKNGVRGWMMANMIPPWPNAKFEAEFKGLLNHDIRTKGPLPIASGEIIEESPMQGADPLAASSQGNDLIHKKPQASQNRHSPLIEWRVDAWAMGAAPLRKFLVPGLILAKKQHLFAAEGGAGKTFLLLDLALKIAVKEEGDGLEWCGMPLAEDAGGSVVMFTTEDDKEELHLRISDIDKDAQRFKAASRLIVVPTINAGGSFPLIERQKHTGTAVVSKEWGGKLEEMREIKDLKLVIIDTFNSTMHGEENSATIVNEYMRAASMVCGDLGAALIITHHVRKPSANSAITTVADMAAAVRGSTALSASMRAVIGLWHAHDYRTRLTRMGVEPEIGRLYNLAIVKANNPEMIKTPVALLRANNGLLIDTTARERAANAIKLVEEEAWMLKAVEEAAKAGFPFTATSPRTGPYARRHELPNVFEKSSRETLEAIVKALVAHGLVVTCNPKGGKTLNHLDIPGGPLASHIGHDGLGAYVIAEGAWTPPVWHMKYGYDPILERVVHINDVGKVGRWYGPRVATAAEQEAGYEGIEEAKETEGEPEANPMAETVKTTDEKLDDPTPPWYIN